MKNPEIWSVHTVSTFLQQLKTSGNNLKLPDNAFCTASFSWNEILNIDDEFFEIPPLEILKNLYAVAGFLEVYRATLFPTSVYIKNGWRTAAKHDYLKKRYNQWVNSGMPYPEIKKPSDSSLHLKGLAIDFVVSGLNLYEIKKLISKSFVGEIRVSGDHIHFGLTTFLNANMPNSEPDNKAADTQDDLNGCDNKSDSPDNQNNKKFSSSDHNNQIKNSSNNNNIVDNSDNEHKYSGGGAVSAQDFPLGNKADKKSGNKENFNTDGITDDCPSERINKSDKLFKNNKSDESNAFDKNSNAVNRELLGDITNDINSLKTETVSHSDNEYTDNVILSEDIDNNSNIRHLIPGDYISNNLNIVYSIPEYNESDNLIQDYFDFAENRNSKADIPESNINSQNILLSDDISNNFSASRESIFISSTESIQNVEFQKSNKDFFEFNERRLVDILDNFCLMKGYKITDYGGE